MTIAFDDKRASDDAFNADVGFLRMFFRIGIGAFGGSSNVWPFPLNGVCVRSFKSCTANSLAKLVRRSVVFRLFAAASVA